MIDIALVEYINTRPFLDGFEKFFPQGKSHFHLMPPSQCATYLQNRQCQLALIPVGAITDFEQVRLMPEYCIGANGEVASVFLFSQHALEELDTVILDRHSRTSNALVQILLKYYWKKEVIFKQATDKHFDHISGKTGGVVIGDKAIKIRPAYTFAYDLAEAWKYLTGLPFAFAVWAYDPMMVDPYTLDELRKAMRWGVRQAGKSAEKWADHFRLPRDFAKLYLEKYIDFSFDAPKHRALGLFLKLQKEISLESAAVSH